MTTDKQLVTTAMILAAGRGARLRPVTDNIPKPLVKVAECSLLERHIRRLIGAGIKRIVINIAYLPERIKEAVGNMAINDVEIIYSEENAGALETAGGILQALPDLAAECFLVVNADVWTDYDFNILVQKDVSNLLAHLVMVDTPADKSTADFFQDDDGYLNASQSGKGLTFSGISLMQKALFTGLSPGKLALRPVLEKAIVESQVTAEHYSGEWYDVGTVSKLQALQKVKAAERP